MVPWPAESRIQRPVDKRVPLARHIGGKHADLKGLHRVKAKLAGGKTAVYFYAWRCGPRIVDPMTNKPLTDPHAPAFRQASDALKKQSKAPPTPTGQSLVGRFRASTEFTSKAKSTETDHSRILKQIENEFGDMPLKVLSVPRTRGDFKEWCDGMAATPRTADLFWSVRARLMSVSKDHGLIPANPCERGGRPDIARRARRDPARQLDPDPHLVTRQTVDARRLQDQLRPRL